MTGMSEQEFQSKLAELMGDPADAPEWLQDRLALKLYRLRGTSPWPNCG